MKKILIRILAMLCGVGSVQATNEIVWEMLGNRLNESGNTWHLQRYTVTADSAIDAFAFCQLKRPMEPKDTSVSILEILPGYYQVSSPRFKTMAPGDTVTVDILTHGVFCNHLMMPDGVHMVKEGRPVKTDFVRKRITAFPAQWVDPSTGKDYMTYADRAYEINDTLRSHYSPPPYMQIPTPKRVMYSGPMTDARDLLLSDFLVERVEDPRCDYSLVEITPGGVILKTNSTTPSSIVEMMKRRISESTDQDGKVPVAVIEDWSDYPYRGMMLDVARNFTGKEDVKVFIDLMARYGLNMLHFHLGEDEAWRLELPSLPELTEVGSRRGYILTDDVPFLKGIYSGDGNPDSPTVANGFYTVEDFIELLQYAASKGVSVIPEFDTPGHSRAAIRSMEWRHKTTGDPTLRLVEDGDTSKYSTAQDFYDNLMNPAIEGPYRFWSMVFDDIIEIYRRAGVVLPAINIGGDEVPKHAWDGSPAAQRLMKEKGMTDQRELQAYFVKRLADIAREKDVKIAGWQEIALNHSEDYDRTVLPLVAAVNSWTYPEDKHGQEMARKGYPVILSNVNYLYFDQHHSGHPDEQGMWWGGIVHEFSPLHATLDTLLPGDSVEQANVKGISAHIFAETVRDFPMVQKYLLPRILGLAERAHNAKPTISDNEYFGLISREMKRWNEENLHFFVRQPGVIVSDGTVYMNEPYGMGEIRYTLDGSEPDETSALYEGPFLIGDFKEIRAKLYTGNSSSATSILYNVTKL